MKRNIKSVTLYRINAMGIDESGKPEGKGVKYSYAEYDESGQLLSEIRYDNDGDIEEKNVNTYDEQGMLKEEFTYLNEDEVAEHKAYERDAEGKVLKAYKIYQDGENDTIHYKRDADGNLIEKITIDSYNEEESREIIEHEGGKVKNRKRFEYDELMLEESFVYDDQGIMTTHTRWSIDEEDAKYLNQFDNNGNLIKTQKFNKKDQLISKAEYNYQDNKLIGILEENQYSTDTTTLTYNAQGDVVEQTELNKAGKVNNRAERTYNENHDVIESEVWINQHGKGVDQHYIVRYEYEYH